MVCPQKKERISSFQETSTQTTASAFQKQTNKQPKAPRCSKRSGVVLSRGWWNSTYGARWSHPWITSHCSPGVFRCNGLVHCFRRKPIKCRSLTTWFYICAYLLIYSGTIIFMYTSNIPHSCMSQKLLVPWNSSQEHSNPLLLITNKNSSFQSTAQKKKNKPLRIAGT